jgi:hypothetical protein
MMALHDCFSGYHQIWLRKEDEEKTSFITTFGTYCYVQRRPNILQNDEGGTKRSSGQKCVLICRGHHRDKKEESILHL